jgi:hypothetical protein
MTTFTRFRTPRRVGTLVAVLALLTAASASAATITIINNDGAGEGFNDPTPRAPAGGNPGTTVGDQRLYLFQYAANIWGGILPSTVPILVRSQFDPQTCNATSAVLGSAGPVSVLRDFPGAEFPATWYHQALANRLSGSDLDAANPDINATFNSNLDQPTCLGGIGWYYGVDGLEGTAVELLPVLLHEMGHGLGFSTTTSGSSGNQLSGFPGAYDRFLLDMVTGLHWTAETATQRKASAISNGLLVWDGPATMTHAATFLSHRPVLQINSPGGIAGTYQVGTAAFGGPITAGGVTGNVVLMQDAGGASTTDGCDLIANAAAIAGNIALVDRGTCTFVAKAESAQAAGATALLIANNTTGIQPPGGTDPTITIPVVGISQADGNTIKANLALGVNVTLHLDPVLLAGADAGGHVLMYSPNPFQSGSSVSHWDVSLTPNALMEPAINNDLHDNVDLTRDAFDDLGWFGRPTPTLLAMFTAEGRGDGIALRWQFSELDNVGAITLQRAEAQAGPWSPIAADIASEGAVTRAFDAKVEPGKTYWYRLSVMDRTGVTKPFGLVSAQRAGSVAEGLFFSAPVPNPSDHGTNFGFRIANPEFVRLTLVDATGRVVRVLQNAMMPAGEHTRFWDGNDQSGRVVSPGLYFANLRTSQGVKIQRVAVVH